MIAGLDVETSFAWEVLAEKKLYKFRGIASDEQKGRLKEIVVGHRIRFSRLSKLNDPVEGKPMFVLGDWESQDYRQHFEKWVLSLQSQTRDKREKEKFVAWLKTLSKADHEGFIQEIVKGNQARIEARWRILSLSANPSHELLWSHYANGHRGVALVFDASDGEFGSAIKLTYVEELVPMDITDENEASNFRTSLLTKRAAWAYEDEYRCVAADTGDPFLQLHQQFLSFEPRRLLGIIFGANLSHADKDEIVNWSRERPVPLTFWQATISINGSVVVSPYAP
jgi:hypothetical protein